MLKKFMPELMPHDRLIILQQNADKVEITTYQKPLTEEAKSDKREILTDNSIQLFDLEEEKKEAVKVFKEKIDPLKKSNNKLLLEIRTGQESVAGTLFHMANHEDGMMEVYDNDGLMVESRRLKHNEKQGNLLRAVAN